MLNLKISHLESKNIVAKQAHTLLSERIVDMERQYWANIHYSRRKRIEAVGIHDSVYNNELEDKFSPCN